jgi:ComF family protein
MKKILKIMAVFFNFIFPIECLGCEAPGRDICSGCLDSLLPPKQSNYPWIVSLGNYHDPIIKKIMWHIKNQPNHRASLIIAEAFARMIMNRPIDPNSWILVPIPITKKRFRERGYNQSLLLAQPLAYLFNLKKSSRILIKIKHTKKQGTSKSRAERMENINGSFSVPYPQLIVNKNIILIDDITTTGSTLIEARELLLASGASRVMAWTVAN